MYIVCCKLFGFVWPCDLFFCLDLNYRYLSDSLQIERDVSVAGDDCSDLVLGSQIVVSSDETLVRAR